MYGPSFTSNFLPPRLYLPSTRETCRSPFTLAPPGMSTVNPSSASVGTASNGVSTGFGSGFGPTGFGPGSTGSTGSTPPAFVTLMFAWKWSCLSAASENGGTFPVNRNRNSRSFVTCSHTFDGTTPPSNWNSAKLRSLIRRLPSRRPPFSWNASRVRSRNRSSFAPGCRSRYAPAHPMPPSSFDIHTLPVSPLAPNGPSLSPARGAWKVNPSPVTVSHPAGRLPGFTPPGIGFGFGFGFGRTGPGMTPCGSGFSATAGASSRVRK